MAKFKTPKSKKPAAIPNQGLIPCGILLAVAIGLAGLVTYLVLIGK